jgi:TonB family protein
VHRDCGASSPGREQTTPAPAGLVFDVDSVDVKPERVRCSGVVYPPDLQRQSIEGRVAVEFVIGQRGKPEEQSIRLLYASHPQFGDAVVALIRTCVFRPGLLDGRPVSVRMRMPVMFTLRSPGGGGV